MILTFYLNLADTHLAVEYHCSIAAMVAIRGCVEAQSEEKSSTGQKHSETRFVSIQLLPRTFMLEFP